jgi:outer membrane protein
MLFVIPVAVACAMAQSKVGIVHIQNAIIGTKDGQKAAAALQAKFDPKRKELEKKQSDIAAKQAELSKGSNTMAEAKRQQLTREIDQLTKALQRDSEDAQAELEQEQNKILNELGQKLMVVLNSYAKEKAFSLVLDVSSQQTPVLYVADNGVDITKEIVDLYDKNSPVPTTVTSAPAAAPTPAPAAKKTAAPK